MNTKQEKIVRPIRYYKLIPGSKFTIFAEPSRNIRKSKDTTVYRKLESWAENVDNPEHIAILYPEDLVVPMSRG
jgi:hypothetical protein